MKSPTPYSKRDGRFFWRTGVRNIDLGRERFHGLSGVKIDNREMKISSAGSCFAQHVGKWLLDNDYSFCQSALQVGQIASFAFGNIYTPRGLLQWLEMADSIDKNQLEHSVYYDGKKYFDLLRPSFQPLGFDTLNEVNNSRRLAVKEMASNLSKTDLFIFTLGLTEAWVDEHALVYPSCPGVVSGVYDSEIHSFHNFTHDEIMSDMAEMLAAIKRFNSSIRFILTVSPVPLTATATDNHILVASTYSKSVLRSVAGELADKMPDVEYFPSYEVITAPTGDFRFKDNLRTVSSEGVAYVMSHFATSYSRKDADSHLNDNQSNEAERAQVNPLDIDEVCEDALLDPGGQADDEFQAHYNISLIGDSHMGYLSAAMKERGILHCGGGIMNGSAFTDHRFALCDEEYFVPLENSVSRKRWRTVVSNLRWHEMNNTTDKSIVITNIGVQSHRNAAFFADWYRRQPESDGPSVYDRLIEFFNTELIDNLHILQKMALAGHIVVVISDPPFSQHFEESKHNYGLIQGYFNALDAICNEIGVSFLNAASLFDSEVANPLDYASDIVYQDGVSDWFHGNQKYYNWLASKIEILLN